MAIRLSAANLDGLSARIATPSYAAEDLQAGIVHFGIGNFHRAHQAVYLDMLFNQGLDRDWAIVGAGVLPSDAAMRERLLRQDFLTTVVEQDAGHSSARVIAPIVDYLAPGDPAAIIARLAVPAIRIVSLTITEGGYFIDPATGIFNPADSGIRADALTPGAPKTVFGLILAGLVARRAAGIAPFTVMSCDNIPHNGVVTRNAVAGLADLSDPELGQWVRAHVAFPNGMVDRITPATGDREREILARDFGVTDEWPVFCESFKQWVLEDNFPAGRPALEKAGVTFVKDVTPFEHMKIRILNGGHAIIAYPAGLMDIHFVHEAMEHPLIRAFLAKVAREEIIPVLPPVPGVVLKEYFQLIEERFSNPKIGDTIRRLCLDGSNRQPKFIVPGIADRLAAGAGIEGLALESALWCRYCFGTTDSGVVIEANDPNWQRLQATAVRAKADPMVWLDMADIYGAVAQSPVFRKSFAKWLEALWSNGAKSTLERYLAQ